jgi:hypothetical protein
MGKETKGLLKNTISPIEDFMESELNVSDISNKEWKKRFGKLNLLEEKAILLVALPGQRFDFSLTVRLKNGKIFTFFFDAKSKRELFPVKNGGNQEWVNWKQYEDVYDTIASISQRALKGDENGLLRSLKDGQFVYAYCTTYPVQKNRVLERRSGGGGPGVVMNREAAKKYFRFLFDPYLSIRSVTDTRTS